VTLLLGAAGLGLSTCAFGLCATTAAGPPPPLRHVQQQQQEGECSLAAVDAQHILNSGTSTQQLGTQQHTSQIHGMPQRRLNSIDLAGHKQPGNTGSVMPPCWQTGSALTHWSRYPAAAEAMHCVYGLYADAACP
jgi:hypothetical protein